jgi:Glycosyl transferase family 2
VAVHLAFTLLQKLDRRIVPKHPSEIRGFVTVRNELRRIPAFLRHHRKLGVKRFFFADNLSTDGTTEYLLRQSDCHVYSAPGNHFAENVTPLNWTNSLCNLFGAGHWCLTVDADELFVYPHYETVGLLKLCNYLDGQGLEAVSTPMIDMYSAKPIVKTRHNPDKNFLYTCPLFDPHPGWVMPIQQTPGWQMFGGVRRRVFWRGLPENTVPPCISKVPLVRWKRGMEYLAAAHIHSGAKVSQLRGALLHFKFMDGFAISSQEQLEIGRDVKEKGLSEREIYVRRLSLEPELCLADANSVRYEGSAQLLKNGWMITTSGFEKYVASSRSRRTRAKSR